MAQADGHRARKRFGQNFLNDQNIINKIIASIAPRPSDQVIEIGPGLGALTQPLLARLDQLQAVELDRDLIPKLALLEGGDKLLVHEHDALKFDFSQAIKNNRPLRVVGNLPYNISTPLIFHLLSFSSQIQDMHFMLQKEVVERLAAKPNSRDYGRLSVVVQSQCHVEHLFNVSKHCFTPAPKVESAIVRMTPYATPKYPIKHPEQFASLVQQAFSQRRKTLRNNLKPVLSSEKIEACGIDPSRRPETLTLDEFFSLYQTVSSNH